MQIDIQVHLTSQSMKCLLFDCFSNESVPNSKEQRMVVARDGYLVKVLDGLPAEMYIFSDDYSQISNSIKIEHFSSIQCVRFTRQKSVSIIVYPTNLAVAMKVLDYQEKTEKLVHQFIPLKEKAKEMFIFFSDIMRMKKYMLLIGYTSLNQFYLITIKNLKSLDIFKLTNKKISLFSWLKMGSQNFQCKNVFIYPYRIDEGDRFILLLVLRDTLMQLYLVELYPEQHRTTMSLIGSCEPLKKIIPKSARLKQVIITGKDKEAKHLDCLVSYQLKYGFMLVLFIKVNHKKDTIFQISVVFEDLPSHSFSMAYDYSSIFYIYFSSQNNLYKIFKKRHFSFSAQKRQIADQQAEPLLELKQRPYFFETADKLFINTCSQVFSVHTNDVIDSDSSNLEIVNAQEDQSQLNRDHISRDYNRKSSRSHHRRHKDKRFSKSKIIRKRIPKKSQ